MFKIGDKVKRTGSTYQEAIQGKTYEVSALLGMGIIQINGYDTWFDDKRFELIQEVKLKQNWSIRVHSKEQAEVYEKTLIALGYTLTSGPITNQWSVKVKCLHSTDYFWYSPLMSKDMHFESLESFLAWHFQEEETEQQKQIRELEETIQKAQEQIEQLKKGL